MYNGVILSEQNLAGNNSKTSYSGNTKFLTMKDSTTEWCVS